jgi:hypothetical protein
MKTPYKELMEDLAEYCIFESDFIDDDRARWIQNQKEFALICFDAGKEYGADCVDATWKNGDPDFETFYKRYE